MSTTDAPHLQQPDLAYISDEGLEDYLRATARGFQEAFHPETLDLDRRLFAVDRSFGFRVGERWVATCADFERRLTVPGGTAVPAAAVTAVTVHPPYRRRGLLTAMMRHQLQRLSDRAEPLAILWASESPIYGRFGYGPAASRAMLSGETGRLGFLPSARTTGSVDEVDRERYLRIAGPLHERIRRERPGTMVRDAEAWDLALFDEKFAREGATELRYLVHFDDGGEPDGIGHYRFKEGVGFDPDGEVRVHEVWSDDPAAYASLWRYLLDLDLARNFRMRNAPVDEPLRLLVSDVRALRTEVTDNIYLRVVDVVETLQARQYAASVDVVLEVSDPILRENSGRYRLRAGDDETLVERVDDAPDIGIGILELGTAYLGGVPLAELHRVGRVTEHRPGAVASTSAAFSWPRAPWCPDFF